ncbi:hypothetical protein ACFQX7_00960 [Luedemannella flava]
MPGAATTWSLISWPRGRDQAPPADLERRLRELLIQRQKIQAVITVARRAAVRSQITRARRPAGR